MEKPSDTPEGFSIKTESVCRVCNSFSSGSSLYGKSDAVSDRTGRIRQCLSLLFCHTDKGIHILRAAVFLLVPDSFLLHDFPEN